MNSESASEDFDHIQGKYRSLVWLYFYLMVCFLWSSMVSEKGLQNQY